MKVGVPLTVAFLGLTWLLGCAWVETKEEFILLHMEAVEGSLTHMLIILQLFVVFSYSIGHLLV